MKRFGFTLLELMVTLSVMSVLVVIAAPSLTGMHDRYRLKGAVDTLYADLQFARSEAVRRNGPIFIGFSTGISWCYGLDSVSACSCSTPGDCDLKVVNAGDYPAVTLTSTTFSGAVTSFEPRLGTVSTAGTVVFQSAIGKEARAVVSSLGRVRRCSPVGSASITYYPSC